MAIEFRDVTSGRLEHFSAAAPSGATIGIIGAANSGQAELLRVAVQAEANRRYLGPQDSFNFAPCDVLALDHTFALQDARTRAQARAELDRLRSAGTTVLLASNEAELILRLCDEVWWLDQGKLKQRGDPNEVWSAYLNQVAGQFREWGAAQRLPISPAFRRGDGRAEVIGVETLGVNGQPTMVWRSGEDVVVRVTIRYHEPVGDPVIGIMIRTRVGSEVYGTNTELERVQIGPCSAGDTLQLRFAFRCDLCNNEYTLTVASHDRDGTAHDWLDDAIAFAVSDSRYTAGVANLRAKVSVEKI